ncbi:MAG: hypothetical protein JXA33_23055 [Anaerolineae bacterium]|nr:hypothetical protein [Anaerolineae bacterium]
MKSPVMIAMCSIIPGAGFLLLKQYKRALAFGVGVVGLWIGGFVAVIASMPQLAATVLFMARVLWLVQLALAVQIALTNDRLGAGPLVAPRKKAASHSLPKSLPRSERAFYMTRELLRTELAPGERVIKSALCKVSAPIWAGIIGAFGSPFYCIGMTQKQLILIELDVLMIPTHVIRIPFSEITNATLYGKSDKHLELEWRAGGHLKLDIIRHYRKQVRAIVATVG